MVSSSLTATPNAKLTERIDTLQLKHELALLLPEYAGLVYWDSLKAFMNAKIGREEWENRVRGVFGGLRSEGREKAGQCFVSGWLCVALRWCRFMA
ncbi:hypothetical protein BT69DRAFT_254173 [Atractiella rhizophila]|nr:hypothetical protein BT69DRAFT_254173 [Atractiella rhizophila]